MCVFFFCKQKTAYEMRISDWSSDVCSSDLPEHGNQLQVAGPGELVDGRRLCEAIAAVDQGAGVACEGGRVAGNGDDGRHVGGSDLRRLLARAVARRIEQIGRAHV